MENKVDQEQEKQTDQTDQIEQIDQIDQMENNQMDNNHNNQNQSDDVHSAEEKVLHDTQVQDIAEDADVSADSLNEEEPLADHDGLDQEDSQDGPADGESAQPDEKKGFFKKNKKKEKKDKKDEKIEELTDQVKRQMAEFDNFRKRTEKEKTQMYEIGAKSIIEKVLPVVDNFERGLAAVPDELKDDAFVDGMNKIYKQMMTMLEEVDVKPIEAVGKEFDPSLHNAVMQTESEEYESGIVAQELQKGYTYRDSVVRHSMVAVVS